MDMTGETADIHMRTDAKNLVTTAQTTHLPNQKETIHMIQMMRHDACTGQIDDLAHVASADMMADTLTKSKCENFKHLKETILTGWIPNCDAQPLFRELIAKHHKAFLVQWLLGSVDLELDKKDYHYFAGIDIAEDMCYYLSNFSFWNGW